MSSKRTSAFRKGTALQQRDLADAILQSGDAKIGSCGHSLAGRPLWMVGKYDICFSCYEARQREIESSLPLEATVNVKQFRLLCHKRNQMATALRACITVLIDAQCGCEPERQSAIQQAQDALSDD